ncbi:CHASE2 domain-containing protein [Chroococcidiopsis sp.]|uniref:CHASE2 domain-containing protein n=1 Tax=Chroococcidiopsis sp. TaxID=3088168 RepID=UPI003F364ACC
MGKLVVLKFGEGSFEQGFPVTLQIGEDGDRPAVELAGRLPPQPEIPQLYRKWQSAYYSLGLRSRLEAAAVQITNVCVLEDCYNAAESLSRSLNNWLSSPSFLALRDKFLEKLMPADAIRVILQTEDLLLQRLPWHRCDLFARYPQAEIALSTPTYEEIALKTTSSRTQIRILAILGSSAGIDIQADRNLLESLPGADVKFLVEPSRQELDRQLWSTQGWDILFFAGHSASQTTASQNEVTGRIYLNQTESLTIADLKHALQTAVENGLSVAIFNSCDGLGLARDLASLHIPQVVFMREPVPDRVAQEFLKSFLQAFAGGKSLYLSVREARERLQGWESEYPAASWLPVIYQNLAEIPPTWQQWMQRLRPPRQRLSLRRVFFTSTIVTAAVVGMRLLGLFQPIELQVFDQLIRLRPMEKADPRLLIVTVTEEDLQLPEQKQRKGSLSDLALEKLLQKLEQLHPQVIGLDIYRDFPVEKLPSLKSRLQKSDRLFAICKVSDPEFDPRGVQPPPEVAPERIGFSDVLADPDDNIVRRHLLNFDPPLTSRCSANTALSFQLAHQYLAAKGIETRFTPNGNLQLGNVVFPRLQPFHTGGYQRIDTKGYQLLLNYRPFDSVDDIAVAVTLGDILSDRIPPHLARTLNNRIVLIGLAAPSTGDAWSTPYSIGRQGLQKQIPGIYLQAQMVSQLLSAVLDGRPPLWVLPLWGEITWIWAWSLVGGVVVWCWRSPVRLGLSVCLTIAALYGSSWILLLQGGWLPLVPAALALVVTGGRIAVVKRSLPDSSNLPPKPTLKID